MKNKPLLQNFKEKIRGFLKRLVSEYSTFEKELKRLQILKLTKFVEKEVTDH